MTVELLSEHYLEFLSSKEAAQARTSLQLSKCHIVGNLMPRLIYIPNLGAQDIELFCVYFENGVLRSITFLRHL